MADRYFSYGERELAYLRKKDKKLAAAIDQLGCTPSGHSRFVPGVGECHPGAADFLESSRYGVAAVPECMLPGDAGTCAVFFKRRPAGMRDDVP